MEQNPRPRSSFSQLGTYTSSRRRAPRTTPGPYTRARTLRRARLPAAVLDAQPRRRPGVSHPPPRTASRRRASENPRPASTSRTPPPCTSSRRRASSTPRARAPGARTRRGARTAARPRARRTETSDRWRPSRTRGNRTADRRRARRTRRPRVRLLAPLHLTPLPAAVRATPLARARGKRVAPGLLARAARQRAVGFAQTPSHRGAVAVGPRAPTPTRVVARTAPASLREVLAPGLVAHAPAPVRLTPPLAEVLPAAPGLLAHLPRVDAGVRAHSWRNARGRSHPDSTQRNPPPCVTHLSVPLAAPCSHPSWAHRLPPPWEMHRPPARAPDSHPSTAQRFRRRGRCTARRRRPSCRTRPPHSASSSPKRAKRRRGRAGAAAAGGAVGRARGLAGEEAEERERALIRGVVQGRPRLDLVQGRDERRDRRRVVAAEAGLVRQALDQGGDVLLMMREGGGGFGERGGGGGERRAGGRDARATTGREFFRAIGKDARKAAGASSAGARAGRSSVARAPVSWAAAPPTPSEGACCSRTSPRATRGGGTRAETWRGLNPRGLTRHFF